MFPSPLPRDAEAWLEQFHHVLTSNADFSTRYVPSLQNHFAERVQIASRNCLSRRTAELAVIHIAQGGIDNAVGEVLLECFIKPLYPLEKTTALQLSQLIMRQNISVELWGSFLHFFAECELYDETSLIVTPRFSDFILWNPWLAADTCMLAGAHRVAVEIINVAVRSGALDQKYLPLVRKQWEDEKIYGPRKRRKGVFRELGRMWRQLNRPEGRLRFRFGF